MAGESTYVERVPTPALAAFASAVWIQQVGDRRVEQRHVPHGGAEVRCVLGEAPRLLGPLTTATYREIPAGGTVVGVRLRPGVLGGLVGMSADELVDQDIAGTDVWRDQAHLTDLLGEAATPWAALARLQSFVARSAGEPDPLVNEAVRNLMPWRGGRTAALPALLSISERQLRRRCRAAVGLGPKKLHRILRLRGFVARVQASIAQPGTSDAALARWAVEAGYHDQAHLSRETAHRGDARRVLRAVEHSVPLRARPRCVLPPDAGTTGWPFRTRAAADPGLASRSPSSLSGFAFARDPTRMIQRLASTRSGGR